MFVAYGYPLEESGVHRRAELLQRYNFDCKCDRCEPHCSKSDRLLMASDPNFEFVKLNRRSKNSALALQKCIAFLNQYGHLPWAQEMGIVLDIFTNILFKQLAEIDH